jgi:polar amino acid transport system substrate-binding protein
MQLPRRTRLPWPFARARWLALAVLVLVTGLAAALALAGGEEGLTQFFARRDLVWAQMQEHRTFRVGLDPSFPPFEALDDGGVPAGYDVDLARALAQNWGLEVELVTLGYDSLVDALRAGRVDAVISAMPFDERLTKDVTYSLPYFESGLRLAAHPNVPLTTVDDLAGRRLAVEWGSAGDMFGRRLQREQAIALELVPFDTPAAALDAAAHGVVDAVLADGVSLRLAQGQGLPLVAVGPVLESAPYVIVSPRRAPELAARIAEGLNSLQQGGALDQMEERWFGPRIQE